MAFRDVATNILLYPVVNARTSSRGEISRLWIFREFKLGPHDKMYDAWVQTVGPIVI